MQLKSPCHLGRKIEHLDGDTEFVQTLDEVVWNVEQEAFYSSRGGLSSLRGPSAGIASQVYIHHDDVP